MRRNCCIVRSALLLGLTLAAAHAATEPLPTIPLTDLLPADPDALRSGTLRVINSPHLNAPALRWETASGGPGPRLAGSLPWVQAAHLVFDAYYDSDHGGMLELRFQAAGEDHPRLTASLSLFPRLPVTLSFPLDHLDAQRVFLPRTAGRLKGIISGRRLVPQEIGQVTLALQGTGDPQAIELANFRLVDGPPVHPLPPRAIVDVLGQWKTREWPGKTPDADTLRRRLAEQHQIHRRSTFPAEWSRFGGWKQKRFLASGFFRTEREDERWWLVDPEGYAFFSVGLDCVRSGESCAVLPGTESLFDWLPEGTGPMAAASSRRGDALMVDFAKANLLRAFGEGWGPSWRELSLGRLKDWGFNTVANWSELDRLRPLDVPYVLQLSGFPSTSVMLFRDFPDVFSEEYREAARRFAAGLLPVRDDPFLMGYFLRNEPLWGFGSNNLAAEMLEANPGTATRRELARWLSRRYQANPATWSLAWGRRFDSFDQVITQTFRRIAETSSRANEDLWDFSREMVRAYIRIPCEEVRQVDPNHLNLGMRYAWISSDLLYDAGEMFDVFSINCYRLEPCLESVQAILERTGKPVLIGEFHFGALDRGLPATGLRGVTSQEQRGIAYRRYVETAAAHPGLVGVHYFTLNDQAVLGRFDGENYQIGFVDVCHQPYGELVEAARQTHQRLYRVRAGQLTPFSQSPVERPAIR